MRYFIPILFLLCACGTEVRVGEEGIRTIEQANVQNEAIADNLAPEKPIHAAGIKDNSNTIRSVIGVNARNDETKKLLSGLQTQHEARLANLREAWKDERTALHDQVQRNQAAFEAAKKEAEQKGFWLTLVGWAAGVWGIVRVARPWLKTVATIVGGPVAGRVVDWITFVGNIDEKKRALKSLVHGSDKGIEAVGELEDQLNELLGGKYRETVTKVTNGKTDKLSTYLKLIAEAAQTDEGMHKAAKSMLEELRDEVHTDKLGELKNVRRG